MVVKSVAFSQNVREALATVVRQVLAEPLLYEVELVFSFKGVRRVEVPAERIASTRHEGRCPVSGRDSRSEAAMKLSEAILLGAMMKPQAVRALFNHDGACALGGALLAVGATGEPALGSVRNRWPWVFTVSADCPSCGRSGPSSASSRISTTITAGLGSRSPGGSPRSSPWIPFLRPQPDAGFEAPPRSALSNSASAERRSPC